MDCYLTDGCYWIDYKYHPDCNIPFEVCHHCACEGNDYPKKYVDKLVKKVDILMSKQALKE